MAAPGARSSSLDVVANGRSSIWTPDPKAVSEAVAICPAIRCFSRGTWELGSCLPATEPAAG